MLDESWAVETVVVVTDEDDDNDWLEDKSNEDDDDESGSEDDTSGNTDCIDTDVIWKMLDEACNVEIVVVVADGYDDNDWLEDKPNDDDGGDRGTEVDTSGDTESIDTDVSWRMLEESCDEETVVLDADEDDDNDWLEDK